MRTIEIKENDSAQRLDKFLSKKFRGMPNSLLYKYLRTKRIKLNGKKAQPDTFLNEGDVLTLYISDEFFGESDEKRAFLRIIPNVNVVFEDKNIIVVDKPAGMLCHSDDREGFNTLINHIKAYLYEKGEYDVDKEETFAPSLCNRIDRNTCGLVIAAKNASALRIVNEKIKNRELDKRYLAVIHGIPEESATGTANGALAHYLHSEGIVGRGEKCIFIQGEKMGRPSSIAVEITEKGEIYVGGTAYIFAKGELYI